MAESAQNDRSGDSVGVANIDKSRRPSPLPPTAWSPPAITYTVIADDQLYRTFTTEIDAREFAEHLGPDWKSVVIRCTEKRWSRVR